MRPTVWWNPKTGGTMPAPNRNALGWGVLMMLTVLAAALLVASSPASAKDEDGWLVYYYDCGHNPCDNHPFPRWAMGGVVGPDCRRDAPTGGALPEIRGCEG